MEFKSKGEKRYVQFSKVLTALFAVVMLPVSAYTIVACIHLAEMAIEAGFTGSLPYITAIVGFVQAAVAVVLGYYYKNSEKEKVARINAGMNSYGKDY